MFNKVDQLSIYAFEYKPDIIVITEAWTNDNITNAMLNINGYYIDPDLRIDKINSRTGVGAGIVIYVKNDLKVFPVVDNNNFIQYSRFYICDDNKDKLYFTVIYRSPNSQNENNVKLIELVNSLNTNSETHIILGDFNYPGIKWSSDTSDSKGQQFLDMVNEKSLSQVVYFPTHNKGNILDLVLTNKPENLVCIENLGYLQNSDHTMILGDFSFNIQNPQTEEMISDWKNLDEEGFRTYLNNIDWDNLLDSDSTETCWGNFRNVINIGLEKFVPKKVRRSNNRPIWMNQHVLRLIRIKQRRYKTYMRYKSAENLDIYQESDKTSKKAVKNAKKKFEKKLAKKCKNDRQFNSYVKSKTKSRSGVGPLKVNDKLVSDDQEMTECLNNFFSSVFTVEDLSNIPTANNMNFDESINIVKFTPKLVEEKLTKLKPGSASGPDNISPRLLQTFSKVLSKPLSTIFNVSMRTGEVPEDWRVANVTPIFKKGGKGNPGNYRPVSLTSVPGKIMESLIKDGVVKHLDINDLIDQSQHGFMKNKSCTTNLLEFFELLTDTIDQGDCMDVIYLDFSKAFDKVPRERLLKILKAHGVEGSLLKWLESWLSDRKQRVVLNGKFSIWQLVISGVPQGSILGPLLFLIFINNIDSLATQISILRKFADDTKVGQKITCDSDRLLLQECLTSLCSWAEDWGMQFNVAKCKVIHYGRNNPKHEYLMNGTKLITGESEKDIGVLTTNNLKPSSHCSEISRKANFVLNQIMKCFHYRDKVTYLKLYKQQVLPLLEFACPAWNPWQSADIEKLEKVQIRFVKSMSSLKGKTYEEKLKEIGLLSLERRRTRFDLVEVYKILNRINKVNPDTWFKTTGQNSARVTRLTDYSQNLVKQRSKLEVRKNFFSQRVVDLWNDLPVELKSKPTLNSFKSNLDKHLLN